MSYKILLIDDSLYSLDYHSELVRATGHSPISALNGPDGLSMYNEQKPDFILCDIMMPEMDGYEVFAELKNVNPNVILYFVTAETSEHAIHKARQMQAAGIFAKPIDVNVVQNIVKDFEQAHS